ncbi:MAG: GHKL domain-containing protein, partial [Lachnospiraceae bacterium]|nr:GHKL domain-containing protein [Lachnospiraceae bacterium]
LLNLLCFVAVFIANIVMGQTVNYSQSVLLMNCVLFGLCFLSTSIVLLYFTRTIRSEEEKKADQARLEMTENYVSGLEQLIDESRELRHDYKNLIATISGFIEEGDMDHLKEYFDQNIRNTWVDLDKKGKAWQSVKDIQPPELKGILYEKVLKAVASDVNIRVIPDYELNIQYKAMKDLCRIIGILTDNAIEAAEETDEKSVDIRMSKMEYGYQITIQNTYFTKPDLVHLYQKGYSTKGEDRGLGMYYARELILDHEELEFEFEIQEHFVIQKIYIEL